MTKSSPDCGHCSSGASRSLHSYLGCSRLARSAENRSWGKENKMVDQGFLRNFLSGRIIRELDLYGYRREGDRLVVEEKDPQKIREGLVASMDRWGLPSIVIPKGGANYTSSRELYLEHEFEGEELDEKYAQETLKRVFYLWGRPVHLQARIRGSETTIHCSEGPTVLTV